MRTRNESNYRETKSENKCFTPRLSVETSERLISYCREMNFNKTKFVERCINSSLDDLEKEMYNRLSKEELVALLMKKYEKKRTEQASFFDMKGGFEDE